MSNLESWMMFRHFKLFVLTYLTAISFGSLLHAVEDEKYFVEKYVRLEYLIKYFRHDYFSNSSLINILANNFRNHFVKKIKI